MEFFRQLATARCVPHFFALFAKGGFLPACLLVPFVVSRGLPLMLVLALVLVLLEQEAGS